MCICTVFHSFQTSVGNDFTALAICFSKDWFSTAEGQEESQSWFQYELQDTAC